MRFSACGLPFRVDRSVSAQATAYSPDTSQERVLPVPHGQARQVLLQSPACVSNTATTTPSDAFLQHAEVTAQILLELLVP